VIESELFGHKRGSFTGAMEDRAGWFEKCPETGTVFLDEIGELDPSIQVKLLRVLQERTFTRLGERTERPFAGRIIAATNRDVAALMREGVFRHDFYYRLCSDVVYVPSLRQRLDDQPAELDRLVRFIATRLVEDEAEAVADEVLAWIRENLGKGYAWPGNIRELEQCARNVLIRQTYTPPPASAASASAAASLTASIEGLELTADQLLKQYCTIAYDQMRNYEAVGRKLQLDRRTVKAHVDHDAIRNV
jgi:transcriptional regulator with PAS, ATPase and Fis domain